MPARIDAGCGSSLINFSGAPHPKSQPGRSQLALPKAALVAHTTGRRCTLCNKMCKCVDMRCTSNVLVRIIEVRTPHELWICDQRCFRIDYALPTRRRAPSASIINRPLLNSLLV